MEREVIQSVGFRNTKKDPSHQFCWDRILKYPAVPPGLTRPSPRPLYAYVHMLTFDDGGPSLRLTYRAVPFGSLSGVHSSPRFLPCFQLPRLSVKETNRRLLTRPHRFMGVL